MMKVRTAIGAIAILASVLWLLWAAADIPPVRSFLEYGVSPDCSPTGRTMCVDGVEFVEIGPGAFRMGSEYLAEGGDLIGRICASLGLPWGDQPTPSNEMPVHWVEIAHRFWIAKYEITNMQYEAFSPGYVRCDQVREDLQPAVQVSWRDAVDYCARLSGRSGFEVRLPSEAEWEAACRAGSDAEFCYGDDIARLPKYAVGPSVLPGRVGSRLPNEWGLFDVHGNVWEWCADWYDRYEDAPRDGRARIVQGRAVARVVRGGGALNPSTLCGAGARRGVYPKKTTAAIGFRAPRAVSPGVGCRQLWGRKRSGRVRLR